MSMGQIARKYRNLPIRRGAKVRYPFRLRHFAGPLEGHVVYAKDGVVHVKLDTIPGKPVIRFHPYEFDWLMADGQWVSYKDLKAEYDRAWDIWNKRMNREELTEEEKGFFQNWAKLGQRAIEKWGEG
jgi:hypothetical protein